MSTQTEEISSAERKQVWLVGIVVFLFSFLTVLPFELAPRESLSFLARAYRNIGPSLISICLMLYFSYGRIPSFLTQKTKENLWGNQVSILVQPIAYGYFASLLVKLATDILVNDIF